LVSELDKAQADVRRGASMKALMEIEVNEIGRIIDMDHKHKSSTAWFLKQLLAETRAYRRDLERLRLRVEQKLVVMPTSKQLKVMRRLSRRRLRARIHRSAIAIDMRREKAQEEVVDDDNRDELWGKSIKEQDDRDNFEDKPKLDRIAGDRGDKHSKKMSGGSKTSKAEYNTRRKRAKRLNDRAKRAADKKGTLNPETGLGSSDDKPGTLNPETGLGGSVFGPSESSSRDIVVPEGCIARAHHQVELQVLGIVVGSVQVGQNLLMEAAAVPSARVFNIATGTQEFDYPIKEERGGRSKVDVEAQRDKVDGIREDRKTKLKNEVIEKSKTVEKTSIREHKIQENTEDRAKNRPNECDRVVQEPLGAASSSDDKLSKRPPQERLEMWVEQLRVCDITIPRLRAMESLQDAVKTSGGWPAWIVESIGEMPGTSVND
jgi:hypothetical protein